MKLLIFCLLTIFVNKNKDSHQITISSTLAKSLSVIFGSIGNGLTKVFLKNYAICK